MQIRQLNVGYDRAQDRLLLRLSTDTALEYRMWVTRRMLIGIWPGIVNLIQNTPMARQQADPEARKAVVEFQRDKALREAEFGGDYKDQDLTPAIPGEPFLVWGVQMRPAPGGGHDINFLPKEGQGVHVRLQDTMLHAFVKLLQDVARVTDWGVVLELPVAPAGAVPGESATGERKLN